MEKFESDKYRDLLAERLKTTKNSDGLETAQITLEIEKDNFEYKISKVLHDIRRILPKEVLDLEKTSFPNYESVENDAEWETEDVSDKIPRNVKLLIEFNVISNILNSILVHKAIEIDAKNHDNCVEVSVMIRNFEAQHDLDMSTLADELSRGAFINNHNINHVVGGSSKLYKYTKFQPEDEIKESNIWLYSGENVFYNTSQPLMISTPFSKQSRDFFKSAFYRNEESVINTFRERFGSGDRIYPYDPEGVFSGYEIDDSKRRKVDDSNSGTSLDHNSPGYILLHLANLPIRQDEIHLRFYGSNLNERVNGMKKPIKKYNWKEAFDFIIDLRVGKIFRRKQSAEEKQEIKADIERYRKLLRKEFGLPEIPENAL